MSSKTKKHHGERDSAFFRLRKRSDLARLLFTSEKKLSDLARREDLYYSFEKPKKNGAMRTVSAPRDDLKAIQSRISDLLMRIAPPDWLFAPVKGRSCVDNARPHANAASIRLLDIEDFYPSCSANRVIWFFRQKMECSTDVAAILKGIVTKDEALPQGSPCSPIVAYLSYIDLWAEIEQLVDNEGCTLSVYADDLTISGEKVPERMIWEIKGVLRKYGHSYHAGKERRKWHRPAEITGVIVRGDGVLLAPNRQHHATNKIRSQLARKCGSEERKSLQNQLRGREAQMRQIMQAPKNR